MFSSTPTGTNWTKVVQPIGMQAQNRNHVVDVLGWSSLAVAPSSRSSLTPAPMSSSASSSCCNSSLPRALSFSPINLIIQTYKDLGSIWFSIDTKSDSIKSEFTCCSINFARARVMGPILISSLDPLVAAMAWLSSCGGDGSRVWMSSSDVFRYRTKYGAKTGTSAPINARVRGTKHFIEFLKGTHRNHYFRSQNHVWGGLDVFRCRTKCGAKTSTSAAINSQVRATKLFYEFFKETLPNHYFTSQNHVWGCLDVFRWRTKCGAKTGTSGAINARVRAAKLFFEFFQRTLPNH